MVFSALKALIVAVAAAAACHSAALASSESKSKHKKSRHLFVEVLDAKGITDKDWFNEPDPYARVQVLDRKDKSPSTCREGKYEIRPETRNPGWFRTKMICREYPEDTSDLRLRVTLRDDDPIGYDDLGHADVPLSNVTMGEVMTLKVRKESQVVRIRVRDSFPEKLKKRLYFVRNGEMKYLDEDTQKREVQTLKMRGGFYGKPGDYKQYAFPSPYVAAKRKPYCEGNSAFSGTYQLQDTHYCRDYSINVRGRNQALALASDIAAVRGNESLGTAAERAFASTTRVLSSPLASAVDTAVIGLDPLLKSKGTVVHLKRQMRERSQDRSVRGWSLANTFLYDGQTMFSLQSRVSDFLQRYLFDSVPQSIKSSVAWLDLSEVQGVWWSNKDESWKELQSRLYHFFVEQMLWEDDDDDIILVGHAKFFRAFLQAQMQSKLKERIDECSKDPEGGRCEQYKGYNTKEFMDIDLDYCAVLAVDVDYSSIVERLEDPDSNNNVAIVEDVSFLFGSGLWH